MTAARARARTELAPRWRLDAGDYVVTAGVSRDGRRCALGTGGGEVVVADVPTGVVTWRGRVHPAGVLRVAFSADGKLLATSGQDERARLLDAASGDVVRELPGGAAWVEHVAWSPDGHRLATGAGRKVRIWTSAGDPEVETEPLPGTVAAIAWRSSGSELAAAAYGGVHLWNVVTKSRSRSLEWKGSLVSMAWSPDGKVIACGSQDCSVHFWRLKTGQDSEMSGYPFKPKVLAWDARSTLLATSGAATVTVWRFDGKGPEGTRPALLEGHKGAVTALAFSPVGDTLASGAQDTGVLLWAPGSHRKPVRFAFLGDEVTALVWHPDGTGILGADATGNVAFWNTK